MSSHSYICKTKQDGTLDCTVVNTGGYYNDIGKNLLSNWTDNDKVNSLLKEGKILVLNDCIENNKYFTREDIDGKTIIQKWDSFASDKEEILKLQKENCIDLVLIYETDLNEWYSYYWNEWGTNTDYFYIPLSKVIELQEMIDDLNSKNKSEEEISYEVDIYFQLNFLSESNKDERINSILKLKSRLLQDFSELEIKSFVDFNNFNNYELAFFVTSKDDEIERLIQDISITIENYHIDSAIQRY